MLVNSVIIVLREVIEAALMISVLFALSRRQPVVSRWLLPAIGGQEVPSRGCEKSAPLRHLPGRNPVPAQ